MRFKNYFLLLLALLFATLGFSQEIPKSYERKVKRQTRKVERQLKRHDVVLDPTESVPLFQSFSNSESQRNWGIEYLEFKECREKIEARKDKRKVLIVVFDTAGEFLHPSLLSASIKGYSYTGEPLKDEHGHGTHVGGIIASNFTNIGLLQPLIKEGYVKLLPVKILHNEGWGDKEEIIKGVTDLIEKVEVYLEDDYLVIFSNSWGGSQPIKELVPLYEKAEKKGILIAAASGNNGGSKVGYPAAFDNVISVGALEQKPDKSVKRASYSQYGPKLNFVAPGSKIYSTYKDGSFAFLSGTSMGCPEYVAALAVTGSYHPKSTPQEVKRHVEKFATDIPPPGKDVFTGYGAPLIKKYLENVPGKIEDNPDDPGDPIDTVVVKKERVITIPANGLKMVWGIGSFKDQRPLKVDVELNLTTSHLAEFTNDQAKEVINSFFGKSGIMFSDKKADANDAAEWTARFFYYHANRVQKDYKFGVKNITVTDQDGRTFIIDGESIKVRGKYELSEVPELYPLN